MEDGTRGMGDIYSSFISHYTYYESNGPDEGRKGVNNRGYQR